MKLFNKITLLSIGAAMAIGGGVAACLIPNKSATAKGTAIKYNEVVDGSKYFITCESGSDEYMLKAGAFAAKKSADNTAEFDSNEAKEADAWIFTKTDTNKFTISTSDDTPNYLGANNDNNGLKSTTDSFVWTLAEGSSAEYVYMTTSDSSNNTRYLAGYEVSGAFSNFRVYKNTSSGVQKIKLYKYESGGNTTDLTGVKVSKSLLVLKQNATETVTYTAQPATAIVHDVSWSTSDSSIATVSNGTITATSKNGICDITVTLINTEDEIEVSKSLKVVVTTHAGTEEDPFDVIDACNVAEATGNTATSDTYFITGVVSNLTVSSGQAKFDIISGEKTFKAYYLNDANGNKNITASDIHNGDTALFKGQIQNFGGNTPEVPSGGRLISVTSNVVLESIEIRGSITKTVAVDDDFDISELDVYAIFSDNSECKVTDSATITCDPKTATAVGATKITVSASYEGKNTSAEFDVTVEAKAVATKDEITASDFAATGTSYAPTTNKKISTNALYCGLTAKNTGIQINNKNGYGIVSVRTGGRKITSVELEVSTTKKVNIYGSNTPYTFAGETCAELFNDATAGTLQGTLEATGKVTFDGSFRYVGIRAVDGAVKISKLTVNYEAYTAATLAEDFKAMAGNSWSNHVSTATCNSKYATAKELLLTLSTAELETFKTSTDTEIVSARAAYENWCDRNGDDNPYAGAIVTSSRGVAINTSSSIAIVMIAIASITLVGAAMMLKKRKFSK